MPYQFPGYEPEINKSYAVKIRANESSKINLRRTKKIGCC